MIESTKTRYSDEFFFYKNDYIIGNSLRYYGEYSQVELDFLLEVLNSECVVFDVGANIGYHTTAFASKAKKVYAFEPNPHNFSMLQKNTANLKNVELINAAVGDHNGTTKIGDFDPEVSTDNFGMMKCGEEGVDVPLVRLDTLPFDGPDVIKIDVEGYEYAVIKGCEKMLETRRPMFYYEAHETKELKEIYEFLNQYGYNFYWSFVRNFNPNNFKKVENNIFGGTMLISIVAWPGHLGFLPLQPVLGPTDHFSRFFKKVEPPAEENK